MTAPNDGSGLNTLGPVQLIAPGLMGLLQLKQYGRNPAELSQVIDPVLELRDWFMQARAQDIVSFAGGQPLTNSIATGSVGWKSFLVGGATVQVPNNEWWWVTNITVVSNGPIVSGDSISFAPAWTTPNNAALYEFGVQDQNVADASSRQVAAGYAGGFWMPPLSVPQVRVRQVTTVAGIVLQLMLRFTRLPA